MLRRLLFVAVALAAPLLRGSDRAVLIYPREQSLFRRVFYNSHQRLLRAQISARYTTVVHEQVATDDELFAIDVDGAKLLVISGHGDPFSMYLSGRRQRTLDASDQARLARFLSRLDPDATIVLQSCETGRGFAHMIREAAGARRRVIAARGDVPWNGLEIKSVAPFDATIHCQDGRRLWDCTLRLQ